MALVLVALAWLIFAMIFTFRKRAPKVEEARRAPAAIVGIVVQVLAFGLVWTFRREHWWPFPPSLARELALVSAAVLMAWGSNWWCLRAAQILGKHWTVQARVIQGHELITEGPYGIVRNPIYLGMFGLLVATGLVVATWWALLAAVLVFLVGSRIRICAEERLLRETFGVQFADYAKRVPAFFPRPW